MNFQFESKYTKKRGINANIEFYLYFFVNTIFILKYFIIIFFCVTNFTSSITQHQNVIHKLYFKNKMIGEKN